MGCYNVAGTMSNLTIGCGDKIAFFLLSPTNKHYKVRVDTPKTTLISNEGACVFHEPYCPAIFGEYNDYGGVENIKDSQTTKDLEDYFGGNIEDIINQVTGYREDFFVTHDDEAIAEERTEELKGLSGMFEHKEVFDIMASTTEKKNSLNSEGYFEDSVMTLMGFELEGEGVDERIEYSPERYNKKWVKEGVSVYTDGTFLADTIFLNDSPIKVRAYNPCDLSPYISVPYGLCNISVIQHKLEQQIEEQKILEGSLDGSEDRAMRRLIMRFNTSSKIINIANDDIGSVLEKVFTQYFTSAMVSTNNFYYPAMSGEQHGNTEVDKLLHDIRAKILFKQSGYLNETLVDTI